MAGSAVAAVAAGQAAAQTDTTGPAGSEPATTAAPTTEPAPSTTAPPQRPTTADIIVLGFAQSLELAAAQLYGQALPVFSPEIQPIGAVFRRHHQAYAEQLGGMLGRRAPGIANRTLVQERTPAFGAGTEAAIIRAAYDLESSFAASYTALLRGLKGTDGVALVASMEPIEARQAVVLGQALGLGPEELMPLLEGDEPGVTVFTPSQYPIL